MSGDDWRELFPYFAREDEAVDQRIIDAAREISLPAGATAFRQGDACGNYLLVIEGSIKVIARSESGQEIVLYRVRRGSSCVLTTACLLSRGRYPAEGITETPVRALALPAGVFETGLDASPAFRRFVFEAYGQRLAEVIRRVEELRFGSIRQRLARHLLEQATDGRLDITHAQLAAELGSAREVISRQLKELVQQGLIRLERGRIFLQQPDALETLAAGNV